MNHSTPALKNTSAKNTPARLAAIRSLTKRFGTTKALDNISFDIKRQQVLAILGANGAGKTSLINCLLGRLKFDTGDISIFSNKPGSQAAKRLCGSMLQVASLPDTLKIKEQIQLFQSYYPEPMPYEQILNYAGLETKQQHYPKQLSGGEKQRLLFALSIAGNPQLLLLDEPSVAMDLEARHRLWQAISELKQQGTSIVLSTHYLEEADKLADELLVLKQGKLCYLGAPEAIKAQINSSTIRFSTKLNQTQQSELRSLPAVTEVTTDASFTTLQSRDCNQSLPALFKLQVNLSDLSVKPTDLEQAFLHLNQKPELHGEVA